MSPLVWLSLKARLLDTFWWISEDAEKVVKEFSIKA